MQTNLEEFKTIISGEFVFIFFCARHHKDFQKVISTIDSINKTFPYGVEAYPLDVDENIEIAQKFHIEFIPTSILFRNSHPAELTKGILELNSYLEMIKRNL